MVHCLMPKCAPEDQNHTKFKANFFVCFVLDVPVSDQLYSNANFEPNKNAHKSHICCSPNFFH